MLVEYVIFIYIFHRFHYIEYLHWPYSISTTQFFLFILYLVRNKHLITYYNSAYMYVSDGQSLIAKIHCNNFRKKIVDTRLKCLVRYAIYQKQKTHFENFAN